MNNWAEMMNLFRDKPEPQTLGAPGGAQHLLQALNPCWTQGGSGSCEGREQGHKLSPHVTALDPIWGGW